MREKGSAGCCCTDADSLTSERPLPSRSSQTPARRRRLRNREIFSAMTAQLLTDASARNTMMALTTTSALMKRCHGDKCADRFAAFMFCNSVMKKEWYGNAEGSVAELVDDCAGKLV